MKISVAEQVLHGSPSSPPYSETKVGAVAADEQGPRRVGRPSQRHEHRVGELRVGGADQVGHVGLLPRREGVGDRMRQHLVDDRQVTGEHVLRRAQEALSASSRAQLRRRPGRAGTARPSARASSSEIDRSRPSPDCEIALSNSPSAAGEVISALTDMPPAGLAEDRHVVGVAAEPLDVVLHPLQRGDLVEQPEVRDVALAGTGGRRSRAGPGGS